MSPTTPLKTPVLFHRICVFETVSTGTNTTNGVFSASNVFPPDDVVVTSEGLAINPERLHEVKTYNSSGYTLEEIKSNSSELYKLYSDNIEGQYGLGLGDLVFRDKSDGTHHQNARPAFAQILKVNENEDYDENGNPDYPNSFDHVALEIRWDTQQAMSKKEMWKIILQMYT